MKYKRGDQTITLLVVIILAIIVLVALALSFGWSFSDFWEKITGFSSSNIDTMKNSCQIACSTNANYDWCSKVRTLKYENAEGKKQTVTSTCDKWADNIFFEVNTGDTSASTKTVGELAGLLEDCSAITCSAA